METSQQKHNENLREALRQAQEAMDKCEIYYGEASDDSCRAIYQQIKELLQKQQDLVQQEIQAHKSAGEWDGLE